MDPQLLMALLPLLLQSGGGGGGAPTTGSLLSLLGMGGKAPGGTTPVPGTPGYATGASPTTPFAALGVGPGSSFGNMLQQIASSLGIPTIGDLFGVPRSFKTEEIAQGLAGSSPADQLISQFIQSQVLGKGGVLSSKGGAMETGQFAQLMEWLTGSSLPNISGKTGMAGAGNSGMDLPVGRDLARVQQLLGMSPEMSASEIIPFLPKIESMVAGDSGGHLGQLAGNIMAMIDSMSGQKMAHAGSGATNPTGTGGNPLAAAMGAGGGPNKKVMDQIRALMSKGGMSGDTGNLVGASA